MPLPGRYGGLQTGVPSGRDRRGSWPFTCPAPSGPEPKGKPMADSDRPSPFTVPQLADKSGEGPPSEQRPSRSMTVGGLIHELIVFADFYEGAGADIDRAEDFVKPWCIGNRDANADLMQRDFRATEAIDRVRTYVLSKYSAELTIGTARRFLGDLIQTCSLSVGAAEALPLEAAMDRLDGAHSGTGGGREDVEHDASIDLAPSRRKAMSQYLDALNQCPALQGGPDRAVYEWITEHAEGDPLPSFDTWAKYLREARKATGTNKNTSRLGRAARSVAKPDEL